MQTSGFQTLALVSLVAVVGFGLYLFSVHFRLFAALRQLLPAKQAENRRPGRQSGPMGKHIFSGWKLKFFKKKDSAKRERLIRRYLPLVRNVAQRMNTGAPSTMELQDLINAGAIGLIDAFRNYDPYRGIPFESYAVPRIRGAILDQLRNFDWVPQSTRTTAREIKQELATFENIHVASDERLAGLPLMSAEQVEQLLARSDSNGFDEQEPALNPDSPEAFLKSKDRAPLSA